MKPITTLPEYLERINSIYDGIETDTKVKNPRALFFRGHSKTSYRLLPSALRDENIGTEKPHLLNYRDNMPRHSPGYDYIRQRPEILADMQHHELHTRLLDWTFSPLTALFFALNGDSGNENSEVIVLNPWDYHQRFFKESLQEYPSAHDMHVLARSLLSTHEVGDIKSILRAEFHGSQLKKIELKLPFPFVAKYANQRIIHQSGGFTIHGWEERKEGPFTPLDCYNEVNSSEMDGRPPLVWKIQIDKGARAEMMTSLNRLFINKYSIYPDLEGMHQHLKDYASLYSVRKKPSKGG